MRYNKQKKKIQKEKSKVFELLEQSDFQSVEDRLKTQRNLSSEQRYGLGYAFYAKNDALQALVTWSHLYGQESSVFDKNLRNLLFSIVKEEQFIKELEKIDIDSLARFCKWVRRLSENEAEDQKSILDHFVQYIEYSLVQKCWQKGSYNKIKKIIKNSKTVHPLPQTFIQEGQLQIKEGFKNSALAKTSTSLCLSAAATYAAHVAEDTDMFKQMIAVLFDDILDRRKNDGTEIGRTEKLLLEWEAELVCSLFERFYRNGLKSPLILTPTYIHYFPENLYSNAFFDQFESLVAVDDLQQQFSKKFYDYKILAETPFNEMDLARILSNIYDNAERLVASKEKEDFPEHGYSAYMQAWAKKDQMISLEFLLESYRSSLDSWIKAAHRWLPEGASWNKALFYGALSKHFSFSKSQDKIGPALNAFFEAVDTGSLPGDGIYTFSTLFPDWLPGHTALSEFKSQIVELIGLARPYVSKNEAKCPSITDFAGWGNGDAEQGKELFIRSYLTWFLYEFERISVSQVPNEKELISKTIKTLSLFKSINLTGDSIFFKRFRIHLEKIAERLDFHFEGSSDHSFFDDATERNLEEPGMLVLYGIYGFWAKEVRPEIFMPAFDDIRERYASKEEGSIFSRVALAGENSGVVESENPLEDLGLTCEATKAEIVKAVMMKMRQHPGKMAEWRHIQAKLLNPCYRASLIFNRSLFGYSAPQGSLQIADETVESSLGTFKSRPKFNIRPDWVAIRK